MIVSRSEKDRTPEHVFSVLKLTIFNFYNSKIKFDRQMKQLFGLQFTN